MSTIRPALSSVVLSSANQQGNDRKLDELLVDMQEVYWPYSMEEPSPYWSSGRDCLGLDDNNDVMYGVTKKENWLFSAGAIVGLTLLGYICKWLLM